MGCIFVVWLKWWVGGYVVVGGDELVVCRVMLLVLCSLVELEFMGLMKWFCSVLMCLVSVLVFLIFFVWCFSIRLVMLMSFVLCVVLFCCSSSLMVVLVLLCSEWCMVVLVMLKICWW